MVIVRQAPPINRYPFARAHNACGKYESAHIRRKAGWDPFHEAGAIAQAEPFPLTLHAFEQLGLADRPGRESGIERTAVVESAALHLLDQPVVSHV